MECSKYRKNFLTNVILEIKFPQILGLNELNPPSKFQDSIMKKFPYVNVRKGKDVSLDMSNIEPIINSKELIAWDFQSKDRLIKIGVDKESLTIQFDKYTSFKDFFEDVKLIFEEFTKIYNIGIFKINLRYVNEIKIKGSPRDWKNLINNSLISVTEDFLDKKDKVNRSMHVLELKEEDYVFRFTFGMFNSEYPSPITKKEFVLDYSCFSLDDLEKDEVYGAIDKYHKIIYDWFEKSIETKLRDKMGVIE